MDIGSGRLNDITSDRNTAIFFCRFNQAAGYDSRFRTGYCVAEEVVVAALRYRAYTSLRSLSEHSHKLWNSQSGVSALGRIMCRSKLCAAIAHALLE